MYGSAANTSLKKIDNIQYQALRVCTGAIKTTPTAALQVEKGVMPLELRRVQLSLNYWINLRGHSQDHPAQSTLKPCWEKERRETKSFGRTANQRAVQLRIDQLNVVPTVPMPIIPPWILPDATVVIGKQKSK